MDENNDNSIGHRIMAFMNRFRTPDPPAYKPPAPGLPSREVFMPSGAQGQYTGEGPFLYTDMKNGRTTFYPGDPARTWRLPKTIETKNAVVSTSKKGANDPYSTPNIVGVVHGGNRDAYGVDGAYIKTGDPRGRDVHGGGTRLAKGKDGKPDPTKPQFAPQQPLLPTQGCTRGHNEDLVNLGKMIEEVQQESPGVKIPYSRR
jgi:hypothetical protein